MPQYNVTAIVLRRMPLGETDNVLTLYTRELGRVSAIAKGARKAGSRLAGASEALTCARYSLATGKSLEVVTQAEVKHSFTGLRKDIVRLATGQYMAELLGHLVPDEDPHPELFTLLRVALMLLERIGDPDVAARWFELRLLDDLGYAPDLASCGVCQHAVPAVSDASGVFALSAAHGAVLCPRHSHPERQMDHSALSFDAVDYLAHLSAHDTGGVKAVLAVEPPSATTANQTRHALRRYLRYHLDRELKSVAFLDSLQERQPSPEGDLDPASREQGSEV